MKAFKIIGRALLIVFAYFVSIFALIVVLIETSLEDKLDTGAEMLFAVGIPTAILIVALLVWNYRKKKKAIPSEEKTIEAFTSISQNTTNEEDTYQDNTPYPYSVKQRIEDIRREEQILNSEIDKYRSSNTLPSENRCRELVDALVKKADIFITAFKEEKSIYDANLDAKVIRDKLEKASAFEEKAGYARAYNSPSRILYVFEKEYQWKLRDVIEREEEYLIEQIRGPQRNNKRACCDEFYYEIEELKETFSEETLDFAMDAYYRVCEVAGLTPQSSGGYVEGKSTIADVDGMEGHSFEEFCANLLRKNGFINVEKTKGSGDQGVDILAEKDGIKYAIQCKCYSSDLGNKPIQEVFAGKSIYRCQVAAVMTNRFFTNGGLEAARATGVLLWDRRKLQEFIEYAEQHF